MFGGTQTSECLGSLKALQGSCQLSVFLKEWGCRDIRILLSTYLPLSFSESQLLFLFLDLYLLTLCSQQVSGCR